MYTVSVIRDEQQFFDLKNRWDALLAETPTDSIFLTHEWAITWWRSFGSEHSLWIAVVTLDDSPVLIAPMMLSEQQGGPGSPGTIQFIGTPDSDYADLVGTPSRAACDALADYMANAQQEWTSISLVQIPEKSESLRHLKDALSSSGLPYAVTLSDICYSFRYEEDDTKRHEYKFSKPHSLRNSINRIKKLGDFSLERITDPAKIKADLANLFLLHVNRWQGSPTPSYFVDKQHRRFFEGLVDTFAPQGRLCYYTSKVDEIPVCCFLGFEYGGRIVFYTFAHNNYFFKLSPGKLHAVVQSEELVREGYDIDLSRGATEYKRMLSNQTAENLALTVYQSNLSRFAARLIPGMKKRWPLRNLLANRRFATWKDELRLRLSQLGVTGVVRSMLVNIWQKIYKVDYINIYKPGDERISIGADEQCETAWGELDDMPSLATLLSISKDAHSYKELATRLDGGERFAMVRYNGLAVASCWVQKLEHSQLVTDLYVHPLYEKDVLEQLMQFLLDSTDVDLRVAVPGGEMRMSVIMHNVGFELAQRQPTVYLMGKELRRPD